MLITKDFVFIHLPKTGGTFATKMIEQIYPDSINTEKHGTCNQIPTQYQHLPILSIIRNPFDRYVSQYFYGWWRRHIELYCGVEVVKNFIQTNNKTIKNTEQQNLRDQQLLDNLDFETFVYLADSYFKGFYQSEVNGFNNTKASSPLGWHSEQYFRFFFKDSEQIFNQLTETDIESQSYLENHKSVFFLHNENLNQDLHGYLSQFDHKPESLETILQSAPILPEGGTTRTEKKWQQFYTKELWQFVRQRERILFQLFPQYDQAFDTPDSFHEKAGNLATSL